jgi:hypothetical protein
VQPIRVHRVTTGRWLVVTRWRPAGTGGRIEALDQHALDDVTAAVLDVGRRYPDQVHALVAERRARRARLAAELRGKRLATER